MDADQREVLGVAVALDDLVGDAGDGPAQLVEFDQDLVGHAGYGRARVLRGAGARSPGLLSGLAGPA